jgi:cell cycle related kinase
LDVFPQGLGFVLVFEFMVSDLSEMIKDAANPLTKAQVNCVRKAFWNMPIAI